MNSYAKARSRPRTAAERPSVAFDPTTGAAMPLGGARIPPRRGARPVMDDGGHPKILRRLLLALLVCLALAIVIADQTYRPDLSRVRDALMEQIKETTARADRITKEMELTTQQRDEIAAGGVPKDQTSRWTGEKYQLKAHVLHDYEIRIGHLQEDLGHVLARGRSVSADLQAMQESGDGRRVPYLNRLIAWVRKELKTS